MDWKLSPRGNEVPHRGGEHGLSRGGLRGALAGTETIDVYRSSVEGVDHWGVQDVDIEIIEKGSRELSIELLEGREASHTREMLERLRSRAED